MHDLANWQCKSLHVYCIVLDINECADDHGCHHLCNNTDGSFHCYCDPGFILDSNGTTCKGDFILAKDQKIVMELFCRYQ